MFNHNHRIAEIAEAPQRGEEPAIVTLVQSDARLVQHVEHTGESGADLGGKPDALRFAARKGSTFAI